MLLIYILGGLDITKSLSKVSQSVSHGVNTVNINIESVFSGQPRGLSLFISEIRACKTKDQERVRVDAELGYAAIFQILRSK